MGETSSLYSPAFLKASLYSGEDAINNPIEKEPGSQNSGSLIQQKKNGGLLLRAKDLLNKYKI